MRIISHRRLVIYYMQRPEIKTSVENWYTRASSADWQTFADIKKDFNSVDSVGNQHYVFNLKGNDFRLVVVIKFQIRMIYIRFIGTHQEYDRIDCVNI